MAVQLRRARAGATFSYRLKPGANMEWLAVLPSDRVTVTDPEHGLDRFQAMVVRTEIHPDWSVTLDLVEQPPGVYADTLHLPALKSRAIGVPGLRSVPAVTGLEADEIAEIQPDGTLLVSLIVTWDPTAPQAEVRWRLKGADEWEVIVATGGRARVPGVKAGETYEYAVRNLSRHGFASAWTVTATYTIGGDLTPPDTVAGLKAVGIPDGYVVSWKRSSADDYAATEIRESAGDIVQFDKAAVLASISGTSWTRLGLGGPATVKAWVRHQDRSGNLGGYGWVKVTTRALARLRAAWYRVPATASEQAALEALNADVGDALTISGLIADANAADGNTGDNVAGDLVTFHRAGFSSTWAWDGARWRKIAPFLGAELAVFGSLKALNLKVTDADITGLLSAARISSDVRNAEVLWEFASEQLLTTAWNRIDFGSTVDVTAFDSLLLIVIGSTRTGNAVLSREIPVPMIPVETADASSSRAWYSTGGRTAARTQFASGRSIHHEVNLYISRGKAGSYLFLKQASSTSEIWPKTIIGLKNPLSQPARSAPVPLTAGTVGPPRNVAFTGAGAASWSPPSNGAGPFTYRIQRRIEMSESDGKGTTTSTSDWRDEHATTGLSHDYRSETLGVRVRTEGGRGGFSAWVEGTETARPVGAIQVDNSSLTVNEGGSATFRVRLTALPTGPVTVTASESDPDVSVSPLSRTYSSSNWNNYQSFTVQGLEDADADNDAAVINLTASGGGYSATAAVNVAVTDDDGGGDDDAGPLAAPAGVRMAYVTSSTVRPSWPPVSGATHYQVRWRVARTSSWTSNGWYTGTTKAIVGLTAGTSYELQVQAGADGSGSRASAWSGTVTAVTAGGGTDDGSKDESK